MHTLLEDYLAEVTVSLRPMPVKQRTEELRETRAHLENAVVVSRELGQSEEVAAQNVMAQFGTPQDLGDNLVWVWRRGVARNRRGLYRATACAFATLFFLPLLLILFPYGMWIPNSCGFNSPLVAGAICGGLFSKRGIAGTIIGTVLYFYGLSAIWIAYCLNQPDLGRFTEPLSHAAADVFMQQTESVLMTLFFAWAVNCWRLERVRRSRLAVGL